MNNSDIREWRIQLRDNELSIGEESVKAKRKKLEQEERESSMLGSEFR